MTAAASLRRLLTVVVVGVVAIVWTARAAYDPYAEGLEIHDIGWDSTLSSGNLTEGTFVQMFRPPRVPWRYTKLWVGLYLNSLSNPYTGSVVAYPARLREGGAGLGTPVGTSPFYTAPFSVSLPSSFAVMPELDIDLTVSVPGPFYLGVNFTRHFSVTVAGSGYHASGRPSYWLPNGGTTWLRLYMLGGDAITGVSALVMRALGQAAPANLVPSGWSCPSEWWGDGVCHCNCTRFDVDCNGNASALRNNCGAGKVCDWSTGVGSCETTGWDGGRGCEDWRWFAGDGCQMCSEVSMDPDCAEWTGETFCEGVPGRAVNSNNRKPCEKRWTCPAEEYDDGSVCNCGCGAVDPDCTDLRTQLPTSRVTRGCADSNLTCGFWSDKCWLAKAWVCPVGQYDYLLGNFRACSCECGAYDPDCDSPLNSYSYPGFPLRNCDTSQMLECSYEGHCISPGLHNRHLDRRYKDWYEECDDGLGCVNAQCSTGYVSQNRTDCKPVCGDDRLVQGEQCDGAALCDTSACTCLSPAVPYSPPRRYCKGCGNSFLDPSEECDSDQGCEACHCKSGYVANSSLSCVLAPVVASSSSSSSSRVVNAPAKKGGGSAGPIIGGVVGGVAGAFIVVAIIVVAIFFVRRRKSRTKGGDVPLVLDPVSRKRVSSTINADLAETSLPKVAAMGNGGSSGHSTAGGSSGFTTTGGAPSAVIPPPLSPGEIFDPVKEGSTLVTEERAKFRLSLSKLVFVPNGEQASVGVKYSESFSVQNLRKNTKISFRVFPRNTNKYSLTFSPTDGVIRPDHELVVTASIQLHCTARIAEPTPVLVSWTKKNPEGVAEVIRQHMMLPMDVTGKLSKRIDYDEIAIQQPAVGEGAYGTVYRGTWRGNDVAVKELKMAQMEADCGATTDFLREIDLLENLASAYIVHFYGAVLTATKVCLITEFCEKGSLGHVMRHANLNTTMKVRYMLDAARGMNFLHKSGIIHRDLKPDNLLVVSSSIDEKVCCKITDFGTAKGNASALNTTIGVGTPIYMAPEILDTESRHTGYTAKADVYSFGIMLWQVYTEQEPYKNAGFKQPWEVTQFVCGGKRLEIPVSCPAPFAELIKGCWHADPTQRPAFEQIVPVLENILRDAREIEKLAPDAQSPRAADALAQTAPVDRRAAEADSPPPQPGAKTTEPRHHHHRKAHKHRGETDPDADKNQV